MTEMDNREKAALIARLKASKTEGIQYHEIPFRKKGETWATVSAEYEDLIRLYHFTCSGERISDEQNVVAALLSAMGRINEREGCREFYNQFFSDMEITLTSLRARHINAFIVGAMSVFAEVRDEI